MPVSLFQASVTRMQLQPQPVQYLAFYDRVEQELRAIFNGLATKSVSLVDTKSRLMVLRHGLTMQWIDAQGRVIQL
jgi:hypothetical protein